MFLSFRVNQQTNNRKAIFYNMSNQKKPNQKIAIGVMGIPIRKNGHHLEFLLSQRHQPKKPLWHNKWQLIGGGMEFGETPQQTLSREFEEEAQVSVQILWPYPLVFTSTWYAQEAKIAYDSHVCLICYLVSIGNQKPICDEDEETKKMAWFPSSDITQLDTLPNTRHIILETQTIVTQYNIL